jgi:hypothetical protein
LPYDPLQALGDDEVVSPDGLDGCGSGGAPGTLSWPAWRASIVHLVTEQDRTYSLVNFQHERPSFVESSIHEGVGQVDALRWGVRALLWVGLILSGAALL